MNSEIRGILVGMSLGDGYLSRYKKRRASQISFSHSIKQSEYAQHKVELLNKVLGGKATLRYTKYNGYFLCYANKSNPYFKTLRGMLYREGKKFFSKQILEMLTRQGIALWFMDDGSFRLNRKQDGTIGSFALTINTYCSEGEVENIISFFIKHYGIEFQKTYDKKRDLWLVRANTSQARRLAILVQPYIIPSMEYKISCICFPDRQEIPEAVICRKCNKSFIVLKARGLCMNCYNEEYREIIKKRSMI